MSTSMTTGQKPRPWSHTALDNFVTCPHRYHETKVLKRFVEAPGEELLWGNYVHEQFETYLKAAGAYELPANVAMYKTYLDRILGTPGELHVELEMCLNNKLQPCGPWDKSVFVRGYADVVHVNGVAVIARDHKTGKIKEQSKQMKLMALLIFAHFPTVRTVHTTFEWIKFDKITGEWFERGQVMELWSEFLPDLRQFADAFRTDTWQKRQSGLCKGWCPVSDCEFYKPRKMR